MASKVVLVALVLAALVAAATATGESGHAVPLRRAKQSLSWMDGMKGVLPPGMQPSVTATAHRRSMIVTGHKDSIRRDVCGEKECKFISPVPAFKRPPLPPNAEKESKFVTPGPSSRLPPLPPNAA